MFLVQSMYPMIPQDVKPEWRKLGNHFQLSNGDLRIIQGNASKRASEACALEMLEKWTDQSHSTKDYDKLIEALKSSVIADCNYAHQLQTGIKYTYVTGFVKRNFGCTIINIEIVFFTSTTSDCI